MPHAGEDRDAPFQRAWALHQQRRWAEAAALYREALEVNPTINTASNLGLVLAELGELTESERWQRVAADSRPGDPALQTNLGILLDQMGRHGEAEQAFKSALVLCPGNPKAEYHLSTLLISQGRMSEGWPLFESRIRLWADALRPPALPYPEWRGEPLSGRRVLIWREQGIGDQIQAARLAPMVKGLGAAHVTLTCSPPLGDLFATIPDVDEVLPVGATVTVQPHDFWIRSLSLPYRLGLTEATLPTQPYLHAPADRIRLLGAKRIGLVWRGNPKQQNDANRSLPAALAEQLSELGVVSLHPEDTGARDFADTAGIIAGLDSVIAVDTSVGHLSGAMGKPTRVLLPALGTDWRWRRGSSQSCWYPTMKVYRQPAPGDWASVVVELIAELRS